MSSVERVLTFWSATAGLWWLVALGLVCRKRHSPGSADGDVKSSLTVFKPIPDSNSPAERTALARALESFLSQLSAGDELLVGVSDREHPHWQGVFEDWRRRFPSRTMNIISCPEPVQHANPKIAWLEVLAQRARGELWLWSDADVVAPDGLLAELKGKLLTFAGGAITCAYCVRQVSSAAGMLDAAFINAEFLPGALLLGHMGNLMFSFGAATMFRAQDFRTRARWAELGSQLADDYVLGQMLKPVLLAPPLVETLALETTLPGAVQHYYRWQKTIRWCRPASYASLLVILPLLGWAVFATVTPRNPAAWLGLVLQWSFETMMVVLLSRAVRCRMSPGGWGALLLWPPVRALTWLAVWLPIPVIWRSPCHRWSKPGNADLRMPECDRTFRQDVERLQD